MKRMMLLFICLLIPMYASADLTVVQKVQTGAFMGQSPQNTTVTMYIKGNKAKMDQLDMCYLIHLDENKVYLVDHKRKTIMMMTTEQMKQGAALMSQLTGGQKMQATVNKTGNSKTVNGFKCDEYHVTMQGNPMLSLESTVCYSKDIQADEFKKVLPFSKDLARQLVAFPTEIEGVPVESNSKIKLMGQDVSSKSEVVSVSYDAIPASTFELPQGYKMQQMPDLPNIPKQ